MEIRIYEAASGWQFVVVAKNGLVVAESNYAYANKRNALAAAKLIAASKIKVVEA